MILQQVDLADLKISKNNTRQPKKTDADVLELAKSIDTIGLQEPLIVRRSGEKSYEIAAGARRYVALNLLKDKKVWCHIKTMSDDEFMAILIANNLVRKNPSPIEEAVAMVKLWKSLPGRLPGKNPGDVQWETIASQLGKNIRWVKSRTKLVNLIPSFIECMSDDGAVDAKLDLLEVRDYLRTLSMDTIEVIARQTKERQQAFFDEIVDDMGGWGHDMPLTLNEMTDYLEGSAELMELKAAPWELDDDVLLPTAGACSECPNRASKDYDLFGEPGAKTQNDRCLSPKCFSDKMSLTTKNSIKKIHEKYPGLSAERVGSDFLEDVGLKRRSGRKMKKTDPGVFPVIGNLKLLKIGGETVEYLVGDKPRIEWHQPYTYSFKEAKKDVRDGLKPNELEKLKTDDRKLRLKGRRNSLLLEKIRMKLDNRYSTIEKETGRTGLCETADDISQMLALIAEFGFRDIDRNTTNKKFIDYKKYVAGDQKIRKKVRLKIIRHALDQCIERLHASTGEIATEKCVKLEEMCVFWGIDPWPLIDEVCKEVPPPKTMGKIKDRSHIWLPLRSFEPEKATI